MATRHNRKESDEEKLATAAEQLTRVGALTGSMTNSVTYATQAYLDGATKLNSEIIGFMGDRWRRDVDFVQSLARCETWTEAAALQQDWAHRAAQDYFAEATNYCGLPLSPPSALGTRCFNRSRAMWVS
jgi:hypothetical protein